MFLYEYEGKEIFKEYGIKVPDSYVVKGQVKSGGRGKAGLIKKNCSVGDVLGLELKGERVKKVLVEELVDVKEEIYLSVVVDRFVKDYVVVFSKTGGVDVESSSYLKLRLNELDKLDDDVKELVLKLLKIIEEKNATLVEINPLVRSDELIALDSKIVIDDNSLEEQCSGYNFVELDGSIGVIGNGAGMVMATLDVLDNFGGKAANFLDLSGGASQGVMDAAITKVLSLKPKVVLFNIFGGIVRCDEVANAIVKAKCSVPFVVRMVGTNEKEGL